MRTKLRGNFLVKTRLLTLSLTSMFCLFATLCFAQASNNCTDAVLDFSQKGYHWADHQTNGDFTVEDQNFQISIEDNDGILQDVIESGAGLMIGTEPHSVDDYVSIIYQLSQSTSNVEFQIRDLDYKNYGYNNSNQQEAICVYGYCQGNIVFPKITNVDGSVHISDNCAQATKDSKKGHEESVQITFDQCIDRFEIQYGTGNNSPVHNPSYGKIFIGEVGGILASTCNTNCASCEDPCTEAALDFSEHGYDWHDNSIAGNYTVEDQNIQINIEDVDDILKDTSEEGASIKVGIDPHNVDDVVNIRYQLSETSDLVQFIIRDLDYKYYGSHASNQQEKVCVYGYRNGIEVLPQITLVEGSVKISGNCAEAMDDSRNGHDESIEITFTECIDEVLIVYGSGPKTPVDNPTYSKIYIGDHYGFLTNYCEDTCIDCQLVVSAGEDQSICSNEDFEINTNVTGASVCANNNDLTYLWSNGETTPSITVQESGTYSVTVTDCNGCEATDEVNISITPDPDANAGDDVLICEGATTTLTATGGLEYTWSTGETGSTIDITPATTATYIVTVSNGNGCEASDEVTVTVAENPTADAGDDVAICAGESVDLTATGGSSYLWDNGSTEATITVQPNETTTYSVTVTSDEGCIDSDEVSVTVNPNPVVTVENDEICEGETATISASGGNSYSWDNGEETASISISPIATTDYNVVVTDSNGCASEGSATVTVNPNPVVTVENTEICAGEDALLSATGFAVGAADFVWDNGETTPDITVSPAETSDFTVIITDANGCNNTATANVQVNINPTVTVNNAEICVGEEATLTAEGAETYNWNPAFSGQILMVSPAETTEYTVTGTDANGCSNMATAIVTVNTNPLAVVNDATICEGETADLIASGGTSYLWGDGETTATISVNPTETTDYTVTVTDTNGCSDSVTATVTVNPNPTALVDDATICEGETADLTASGGTSYLWGEGETSETISVNPSATADYTVTVTDANGCSDSATATVTVNPNPTAVVNDATICEGETADLIASGGTSYLWGDGETTATISVSPATTTDYEVTVTDTNGCSDSAIATVTVNPNPTAVVNDVTICQGETANLIASGGVSYLWSDGSTGDTFSDSPALTTNYIVTVTDENGCSDSATATITVNANPTAVVNDATICEGETADLIASGGTSYLWGDGETTATISVSPGTTADYAVTVTDANGCSDSAIATVTVNPNPTALADNTTICEGETADLTASGGASYLWGDGETTAAIAVNPTVTTDYTVTVTDANGCSDSATATVTVNPNPTATVDGATICDGEAATLVASGGTSYLWDNSATTATITVSSSATTSYMVTVTDDNGCSDSATATLTVNPNPTAAVDDVSICEGEAANLTASGGVSYLWGDGETTATITVNPASTMDYSVTVTDANGCSDLATATVTVNPGPTAAVDDAVICAGEAATLVASGGTSYLWDNGATTASITVNSTATTNYMVTVTDDNGCTDSATATLTVNPNPVAAVGDVAVCDGETATLTASGGTSYLWENGETTESITVNPTGNSVYTVTVTDDNGCSAEAQGSVSVNLPPSISISADQTNVCEGETVTLTATGADSYTWDSGETTASITVTPDVTTTYGISGGSLGCSTTAEITINVININLGRLLLDSVFCRVPTGSESIKGAVAEESEFESGFAKYYILAYGPDDVIVNYQLASDVNPLPKFNVSTSPDGMYSIHTFIADITVFDVETYLDDAIPNSGKIDDIYDLTIAGGGDLCAKIDRDGAQTELKVCLKLSAPVETAFEVYPNPAKELLYFRNISLEDLITVELSNVEGKVLHQFDLNDTQTVLSFNVKDYPTGIYLMKATTAFKTHTTKVIIH